MDKLTADAAKRDLREYVGMQIRLARVARKMTQRQLSDSTGITAATISRIENGEIGMTLDTLALLRTALVLDITVKPLQGVPGHYGYDKSEAE